MELRQIRYFLAVADSLHFGKAALELSMAAQPLSAQIRKLETELGCRLFERSTRRVRLTPAGEAFRLKAIASLATLEVGIGLAKKAARGESGRLVVDYDSSLVNGVMPSCIRAFRKRYPDVELLMVERSRPDLAGSTKDLLDGLTDVGFILLYERPPTNLEYRILQTDEVVVAVPRNHRLAAREEIRLTDLERTPILSYSERVPAPHNFVKTICQKAGFTPRIAQEAETYMSLLGLVASGMGVTMAVKSFENLFADRIVYRPLVAPKIDTLAVLAWRPGNTPPTLQNFVSMASRVAGHEAQPPIPPD